MQTILKENLPANKKKKIIQWAKSNETTLMAIWKGLQD